MTGDSGKNTLQAREGVVRAVDSGLTTLYWHIGHRIRRDILKEKRAEYGEEIVSALRRQLTWTHFKSVIYGSDTSVFWKMEGCREGFDARVAAAERGDVGSETIFSARVADEAQPGQAIYLGKSIRNQIPFVSAEFQKDVRKSRTIIQDQEKIEYPRGMLKKDMKPQSLPLKVWRENEGWQKADLERDKKFVAEKKLIEGADEVFVNGDSFISNATALAPLFKARMFAEVQV